MDTVICKEVVITTLSRRGKGIKTSPIRCVTQVWEKDGTLIAENDPAPETFTYSDLVDFAKWCITNGIVTGKVTQSDVERWLDSISESQPS